MFGSTMLEVVIGIVFIYLTLSLLCSAVGEYASAILDRRAKFLQHALYIIFNHDDPRGEKIAAAFFSHPLIKGLSPSNWGSSKGSRPVAPTYIPGDRFVEALLNVLASDEFAGPATPGPKGEAAGAPPVGAPAGRDVTLERIREAVRSLPDSEIKTALSSLMDEANDDLRTVKLSLRKWYEEAMDRVSGWYKKHTQFVLFLIGIGITAAFNADTLVMVDTLWREPELRKAIDAAADERINQADSAATPRASVSAIRREIDALHLPLGWSEDPNDPRAVPWVAGTRANLLRVPGLLLTAIALTMGAPFWFDVLGKLVNVRSAGRQPAVVASPGETRPGQPGGSTASKGG